MNKSVANLKEYSPAHDAVMNAALEVVHGVYFGGRSTWNHNEFSIKIPNDMTDMTQQSTTDGDHPVYNDTNVKDTLIDHRICYESIADYPRYGDTLRLFFRTQEEADKALAIVKSI